MDGEMEHLTQPDILAEDSLTALPELAPPSDEERLANHFQGHHHEVQEMLKDPEGGPEHLMARHGLSHILDHKKGFGHISPLKSVPEHDLQDPEGYQNALDYAEHLEKHNSRMNDAAEKVFGKEDVLAHSDHPSEKEKHSLDEKLKELQENPEGLINIGGHLGKYLPDHAINLAKHATNAVSLLNQARPVSKNHSLLDPAAAPNAIDQGKYDQMLHIAQQPLSTIHYLKKGQLTDDHMNVLKAMYPKMHQAMKQKIYDRLVESKAKNVEIPYSVRIGLSKFLGMPLDATLAAQAIAAAQPTPPPPVQPGQGKTKKKTSTLGKSNKTMFTPPQASEAAEGLDQFK